MRSTMLIGKCALVLESTSGIGWGIAEALAKAGASIMLHGPESQTERDVKPLIEKLKAFSTQTPNLSSHVKHQPKHFYENEAIETELQVEVLLEKTTAELGKIDILVNNSGLRHLSSTHTLTSAKWEEILHTNLTIPFLLSRAVLPKMYKRGFGRLIHLGSANSLVGSECESAWVASKHGLLGMSKVIALEAAGRGVTSNTICPGVVLTPFVQREIEHVMKTKNVTLSLANAIYLKERQGAEEFVTPEAIGALAAFLCSEHGAQVTGAAFSIDGGWTAR